MPKRIENVVVDPNTGEVIETSISYKLELGDRIISKAQQEFTEKEKCKVSR